MPVFDVVDAFAVAGEPDIVFPVLQKRGDLLFGRAFFGVIINQAFVDDVCDAAAPEPNPYPLSPVFEEGGSGIGIIGVVEIDPCIAFAVEAVNAVVGAGIDVSLACFEKRVDLNGLVVFFEFEIFVAGLLGMRGGCQENKEEEQDRFSDGGPRDADSSALTSTLISEASFSCTTFGMRILCSERSTVKFERSDTLPSFTTRSLLMMRSWVTP